MPKKANLSYSSLFKRLGYTFKNNAFLKQALTHCSSSKVNNERYEFLGDSILNFIITEALFEQFPNLSEGDLSRLRSYLVRGEMLAEIASEIQLGKYLLLGQGELKTGGFRRESILADALEATIAAVFLDDGISACKELIHNLYHNRLNEVANYTDFKDAKTQLQEYLQAQKKPLPQYNLVKIEGAEHTQTFHISCQITDMGTGGRTDIAVLGSGSSRRKAEQAAAKLALKELKPDFPPKS